MIYEDIKLLKTYKKEFFVITYVSQKTKQWILNKQNLLFSGHSANGCHYQCNKAWHVMVT